MSFVPLPDMWFPSFFAFESVSKPSYFIRLLPEEDLVLDKYDGTKDFKKDASFSLGRKPDASKFNFFYLFLIIRHFFAMVSCMLYSHARISVRQITTMEFLGNASFPFIKA